MAQRALSVGRGATHAGGYFHPIDGEQGRRALRGMSAMKRFSLLRVYAVLAKEFTQLRRDRITFAMILGIPIMQLTLFGYAINNDPRHLPAAVISHDPGNLARAVVNSLEHT